eukprot:755113-Hanusia_phi.AAC.1
MSREVSPVSREPSRSISPPSSLSSVNSPSASPPPLRLQNDSRDSQGGDPATEERSESSLHGKRGRTTLHQDDAGEGHGQEETTGRLLRGRPRKRGGGQEKEAVDRLRDQGDDEEPSIATRVRRGEGKKGEKDCDRDTFGDDGEEEEKRGRSDRRRLTPGKVLAGSLT